MYDVIVLGSGPAGLTAALYTARAKKKTLVLGGDSFGGQLNVIHSLENYPGFIGTGPALGEFMKKQAMDAGAELEMEEAAKISAADAGFAIATKSGKEYSARALIIATGAKPRKMEVKGAKEFLGRGVSYCATCDGFFYNDKEVIIVGGGNSALSDALYMANIAKTVKIVYRKDSFARAEQVLVDRVKEKANISVMWHTELAEVGGSEEGVAFVVTTKGEKILCDGVFVAIGHEANTDYLNENIARDNMGRLVPEAMPTGMYIAGDVRSGIKMQVATAVGWGCEVAMDAIAFLNAKK